MPALTFIAIGRLVLAGVEIAQSLYRRTNELITFGVILEMIRAKLMFANDLGIAIAMGVLVESRVFDIVLQLMLLQIVIILLAAIGCVLFCNIVLA